MKSKLFVLGIGLVLLSTTGCNKLKSRDRLNKGIQAFKSAKYPDAVMQTVVITGKEAGDLGDATVAVDRDSHGVVHISSKKTQSQCGSGWIHSYRRRRRNEQVLQ